MCAFLRDDEFFVTDLKIVTEMPSDKFKRPKLNKHSNGGGSSSSATGVGKRDDGDELFKPSFSRRSIEKPDFHSGRRNFANVIY